MIDSVDHMHLIVSAKGQVRVTDLLRYIEGKEVGGTGATYPTGEEAVVAAPREYTFSGASQLHFNRLIFT